MGASIIINYNFQQITKIDLKFEFFMKKRNVLFCKYVTVF